MRGGLRSGACAPRRRTPRTRSGPRRKGALLQRLWPNPPGVVAFFGSAWPYSPNVIALRVTNMRGNTVRGIARSIARGTLRPRIVVDTQAEDDWALAMGSRQSWYDVMQACLNGHIITSTAKTDPQDLRKRCSKCGEETITHCPKCNTEILGCEHIPHLGHSGPSEPPAYCHECGAPYPWTERRKSTLGQQPESSTVVTDDVFVVHGHDEEMKQSAARALSQLELKPIILHEQANEGRTLIEKFERNANVQFAVVLLSPDDLAYARTESAKNARPRPRQNVVLELGYFAGKLGRDRVFALKLDDDLELPTDISGIVYTLYDGSRHWRIELARELKAAGYDVDLNKLI